MANNTGNPLGSDLFPDFQDNVQNLDVYANTITEVSSPDRFGRQRKTLYGMETDFANDQSKRNDQFNAFIEGTAFERPPLEFVEGVSLTVERSTQLVSYQGNLYSVALPQEFPFRLPPDWASAVDYLTIRTDEALRQQLGSDNGVNLVHGAVRSFDSTADLSRAGLYDGEQVSVKSYYAGWAATLAGASGGGTYTWSQQTNVAADNGVVFAPNPAISGRWLKTEVRDALDYGCIGDGVFDNLARANAYAKWAFSKPTVRKVKFPAGIFKMSGEFILDGMPFTLDQFEHRFALECAGVELTKFVFSSGSRLIGFDFRAIGGAQTDIRRFDIGRFTITDTRYAGGISFSPAIALSFVGSPDSRFHDIFVVGCNEAFNGQAVFGSSIINLKSKYTRRGITLNGDAVAGFANTDTVSPVLIERCEIMGSAANITDGWGLRVTNSISTHCQRNRFENWINVPSIWFEGVRGSSIVDNYIEGSYAAHAVRLGGRGTMDREADITQAVRIEGNRFYDSLGIVFFPGVQNCRVGTNYFHFGLSTPIADRTSNIHVTGMSGQLGTVLHDNEIDSTNVFTSEFEPTELTADSLFGVFTRNGIYYGRKSLVDGTWSAFYPTTLSAGKTILPSNFAADGAFMGLVERGGTKGTLNATASTTIGSATVIFSNTDGLYPTNFVTIVGAVTRGRVLAINRTTGSVILDTPCSSTVSGAVARYEPPIIRRLF